MRSIIVLALTPMLTAPALAAYTGPGSGANVTTVTTVGQALKAADYAFCILEGNNVEKDTSRSNKTHVTITHSKRDIA